VLVDIQQEKATVNGDIWPKPRRIVDASSTIREQTNQLQDWLDNVFAKFLQLHGPFKTVND
jgi:hypothetical protein